MADTGEKRENKTAAPGIDIQSTDADTQNGYQADKQIATLTESQPAETEGPGEADITQFIEVAQQLEHELTSIVVGQERVIRELLLALLAGGHVLLEGVPGLGKT